MAEAGTVALEILRLPSLQVWLKVKAVAADTAEPGIHRLPSLSVLSKARVVAADTAARGFHRPLSVSGFPGDTSAALPE